ncbi:MAG: hypothetical protein AAF517_18590, partial [Planctomycetota bacterium]
SLGEPLSEGQYEIEISTDVTDVDGNALAEPASWTFFAGFEGTADRIERGQTLTRELSVGGLRQFVFPAIAGAGIYIGGSLNRRLSDAGARVRFDLIAPSGSVERSGFLNGDVQGDIYRVRMGLEFAESGTYRLDTTIENFTETFETDVSVTLASAAKLSYGDEAAESYVVEDEIDYFFFDGNEGDVVSVVFVTEDVAGRSVMTVEEVNGRVLKSERALTIVRSGIFILPYDGEFIVTMRAVDRDSIGAYRIAASNIDEPTLIVPTAPFVEEIGTIDVPSDVRFYRVPLTAGQLVSYSWETSETLNAYLEVLEPEDSPFYAHRRERETLRTDSNRSFDGSDVWQPAITGDYIFRIQMSRSARPTGDFAFRIYAPESSPIDALTATNGNVDEEYGFNLYSIDPAVGEAVIARLENWPSGCYVHTRLYNSTGIRLSNERGCGTAETTPELTRDGPLSLAIDPTGSDTGTYDLNVISLAPPTPFDIVKGTGNASGSLTVPGERIYHEFEGSAGQSVTITLSIAPEDDLFANFSIYPRRNSFVWKPGVPRRATPNRASPGNDRSFQWELPETGTYVIEVDGSGDAISRTGESYELEVLVE